MTLMAVIMMRDPQWRILMTLVMMESVEEEIDESDDDSTTI